MLITRFGTRLVCVAGNLMAAIGLVAASFSWNLVTFLLTYSLITGVGFGLMYIPAILAVAHHFKTQRSLALGDMRLQLQHSRVSALLLQKLNVCHLLKTH